MAEVIFPRSPREMMDGWMHLPRLIDKIRLQLAGKLHPQYQENFLHKGFDQLWFESAGVAPDQFVKLVSASVTDGEVCNWVRRNVPRSAAEKSVFAERVLSAGTQGEEAIKRLAWRKQEAGMSDRHDIACFVDYIDADEGRM